MGCVGPQGKLGMPGMASSPVFPPASLSAAATLPTDRRTVHLWGNLYGIPWDGDTGWVPGGNAYTDYRGHCDSALHKAASGPYTWGAYSC